VCVCTVREERAGSAAPPGPLAGVAPHQASWVPWPLQVWCFFPLLKIVSVFLGSIADPDSHPDPYNFAGPLNVNSIKQVRFL
jgi:hypothetical protein